VIKLGKKKGYGIAESTDIYSHKKVITNSFNGRTRGGWLSDTPKNRELLERVNRRKERGELR
jgi:hypothetical protein